MKRHVLPLLIVLSFLVGTLLAMSPASAGIIESPDREVKRPVLTYAEPMPTARHPHRVYFELTDGSAYRYVNYRVCIQAADVYGMICVRAFMKDHRA